MKKTILYLEKSGNTVNRGATNNCSEILSILATLVMRIEELGNILLRTLGSVQVTSLVGVLELIRRHKARGTSLDELESDVRVALGHEMDHVAETCCNNWGLVSTS